MASVTLREITKDNYLAIHKLQVRPDQEKFVATNAQSLSQSKFHDDAWYRAIYADDEPVGFVMLSIDREKSEYFLWRFMIDAKHQGCGYGKKALQKVVEFVGTLPVAKAFFTSHRKGDGSPEGFYLNFGFQHTGEVEDGEHLMKLDLADSDAVDNRLVNARFPRTSKYNPYWILENCFGANPLWLAEWLAESMSIEPGMRVLDLGCGRAKSSIFLAQEFDVQVWAADLWVSASENSQRIRAAGLEDRVYPIHCDARSLPFAGEFFDAIVSLDSFSYYGSDGLYLNYISQFVKPGGQIGVAGAGLVHEFDSSVPDHLTRFWTQDAWALHSAAWWHDHWQRTGLVEVEIADTMSDGIGLWQQWADAMGDCSQWYLDTLAADGGNYLGYIRMVGRRKEGIEFEDYCWPDTLRSWPVKYESKPLFLNK